MTNATKVNRSQVEAGRGDYSLEASMHDGKLSRRAFLWGLFSTAVLAGCGAGLSGLREGPNQSYFDSNPDHPLFKELAKRNPEISYEFGKLPQFQKRPSETDFYALNQAIKLYDSEPHAFENFFRATQDEGYKNVRAFNPGVEGLSWLCEEDLQALQNKLINYKDTLTFLRPIWGDMGVNALAGSSFYKPTSKDKDEEKKWNDFDIVTSRLSLPELTHRYQQSAFRYVKDGRDYAKSPKQMFNDKKGDCEDWAIFASCCNSKNGWWSEVFNLYSSTRGHTVEIHKNKDNKIYLTDLRYPKIEGPFDSKEQVKGKIGREIHVSNGKVNSYPWRKFLRDYIGL